MRGTLSGARVNGLREGVRQLETRLSPELCVLLPRPVGGVFRSSRVRSSSRVCICLRSGLQSVIRGVAALGGRLPLTVSRGSLLAAVRPRVVLGDVVGRLRSGGTSFRATCRGNLRGTGGTSRSVG